MLRQQHSKIRGYESVDVPLFVVYRIQARTFISRVLKWAVIGEDRREEYLAPVEELGNVLDANRAEIVFYCNEHDLTPSGDKTWHDFYNRAQRVGAIGPKDISRVVDHWCKPAAISQMTNNR